MINISWTQVYKLELKEMISKLEKMDFVYLEKDHSLRVALRDARIEVKNVLKNLDETYDS